MNYFKLLLKFKVVPFNKNKKSIMAEIIRMPLLSDTMTEGTVVAWHKKVGDKVETGETLFEVETDKAVMEQDSYYSGTLLYIGVQEGESVPIDAVMAVIGEEGEDFKAQLEAALAETPENAAKDEAPAAPAPVASPASAPAESPAPIPVAAPAGGRIKASPLAKSMAEKEGIDLAHVTGTGDDRRIVKRDIEAYMASGTIAPTVAPAAINFAPAGAGDQDIPVSQMRKTIARRLSESKFGAPHFYLTVSIDMEKAVETRKRINEIAPQKISFNDLVIKAAAVALRQHPAINSSWLGDKIRVNGDVNIGVAVAVDEGLLVPVVRHADMKSLSQINGEVRELAGKAKERKLSGEEMQGNTFTISNLGMFGIEEFTAIINPPDACIMAVGGIADVPVVKDGELAVGKRMKVTLSCDHRVVDGASGAQFLQTFRTILEDPIRMIV